MPRILASALESFACELLRAAGALEIEAQVVARHCVGANLAGHDSHGVINIPHYIDRMKRGHIVPGAEFEIVEESAATTVVTEFAEYLRSTPTMEGVERVYYPGEIEHLRASRKRREGVDIAPATWDRLSALAGEFGVGMPDSSPLSRA